MSTQEQRRALVQQWIKDNGTVPPLAFQIKDRPDLKVEVSIEDLYVLRFDSLNAAKDALVQMAVDNNLDPDSAEVICLEWNRCTLEAGESIEDDDMDACNLDPDAKDMLKKRLEAKNHVIFKYTNSKDGMNKIAADMTNPVKFRLRYPPASEVEQP